LKKCLTECNIFHCIKQRDKNKGIKCGRCIVKDANPICEACVSKDKCYAEALKEKE
jgi:hypothetical protein